MKEIKSTTVRRRYARLPLALALGALVLTPAVIGFDAATAEASVAGKGETSITMSGDARFRGFWREDAAFTAADDTNRQIQHRMRINLDVKAAGGTSLHTRFHMANNAMDTWGTTDTLNVSTDYLYIRVPVGPGTITAGRQVFNYGHKLLVWDGRGDRLTYSQKVSDEFSVFAYYHRDIEAQVAPATATAAADDDDQTRYAVGFGYSSGPLAANLQLRHGDQEWAGGNSGQELFGFLTYKTGDLTVKSEGYFTFGDLWENAAGDNRYGLYIGLSNNMGDTTLFGGAAYVANGFNANQHFGSDMTLFINPGDGSGIGREVLGGNASDRAYALGIGASHKLSPEMALTGKLGYVNGENVGAADWSVVALDAGMAYKINASTTYHIDAIYAKPSDRTADDDAYWGLSHRFEIKF